jgi:hypothetical protein
MDSCTTISWRTDIGLYKNLLEEVEKSAREHYEYYVGRAALRHSTGEWTAVQQSTGGGTEVGCLLEDAQIYKAIYRKKYICTEIYWRRYRCTAI